MGFRSFAGLALAVALAGLVSTSANAQTAPAMTDTTAPAAAAPIKKVVKPKKVAPKADPAATPADAAPATDAAAKPKPKPKGPPTVVITISNQRAVGVVEVDAAYSGSAASKKIAGAIAPGKKTTAKVVHDKDCLFDVHASFEDGATSDASGVNLCKEKKVNLVE